MISLQNVSRYFGKERKPAIKELCLDIGEGDFLAVVGESGAGKSALLNVIGMLDQNARGRYGYRGRDVFSAKEEQRRAWRSEIGFFPQGGALIPQKTVYGNIALPLCYRRAGRKEIEKQVESIAKTMGLTPWLNARPRGLSAGQYAKAAIARAMVTGPALLLADAPLDELDREEREKVTALLRQWNREGVTIVLATRSMAIANHCRRIITLSGGEITSDFRTD